MAVLPKVPRPTVALPSETTPRWPWSASASLPDPLECGGGPGVGEYGYEVTVRVPAAGRYLLAFGVPSRGLGSHRFDPALVQAAS